MAIAEARDSSDGRCAVLKVADALVVAIVEDRRLVQQVVIAGAHLQLREHRRDRQRRTRRRKPPVAVEPVPSEDGIALRACIIGSQVVLPAQQEEAREDGLVIVSKIDGWLDTWLMLMIWYEIVPVVAPEMT